MLVLIRFSLVVLIVWTKIGVTWNGGAMDGRCLVLVLFGLVCTGKQYGLGNSLFYHSFGKKIWASRTHQNDYELFYNKNRIGLIRSLTARPTKFARILKIIGMDIH